MQAIREMQNMDDSGMQNISFGVCAANSDII